MVYLEMNPVAFSIGPITVYWYGVMYLLGFSLAFLYCYQNRAKDPQKPWTVDELLDLFFYGALGVIFGGTWGYLLMYQPGWLTTDPLQALRFWEPGRSFHGGLLGVIVSMIFLGRQHQRSFWAVCDFIAPAVPLGIAMGRLGNFINGELWGRVTTVPWAIHFPNAGPMARHPSALYECILEGLILFIILCSYRSKPRSTGAVSALFLIGYGLLRMIAECFREPDWHQGFVAWNFLTMGQVLCVPMILAGLWIFSRVQSTTVCARQ